jgi:hypothetical protein
MVLDFLFLPALLFLTNRRLVVEVKLLVDDLLRPADFFFG